MFSVTKEFTFDMAHRLQLPYDSPCQRMHGHTYTCQLTYRSDILDSCGMVRDFSDIKHDIEIVKEKFDHKTLLGELDELRDRIGIDCEIISGNPTAENMAQWIFNTIKNMDYRVARVRVYETPTSYAEYSL